MKQFTPSPASPLPPELQEALAGVSAEERAQLVETWDVSARYLNTEPSDEEFARLGADIRKTLQRAVEQDAASTVRRPAALRLVKAPLRLVSSPSIRWVAVAACMLILVAVGLYSQRPIRVTAPYGDVAVVDLPDGSHVELNSGSSLTYSRHFGTSARSVSLHGEAFFEVTHGEKAFSVSTFNGTTTVLGTRFNVRAWKTDDHPVTDVTVASGRVRVAARDRSDQFVVLDAGQSARLVDRTTAPARLSEPADNALAWRSGAFKFADDALDTVLKEIERRFDVRVRVVDNALLDDPVSIFLENPTSAGEILRDICEYNGYKYRETPEGFEIEQAR